MGSFLTKPRKSFPTVLFIVGTAALATVSFVALFGAASLHDLFGHAISRAVSPNSKNMLMMMADDSAAAMSASSAPMGAQVGRPLYPPEANAADDRHAFGSVKIRAISAPDPSARTIEATNGSPIGVSECDDISNVFTIESWVATPNPPQRGRIFNVKGTGYLSVDISAAMLSYRVWYGFMPIYSTSSDLCDLLAETSGVPQCPLMAGYYEIEYTTKVPGYVPGGTYTVLAQIADSNKGPLTCHNIVSGVGSAQNLNALPALGMADDLGQDERHSLAETTQSAPPSTTAKGRLRLFRAPLQFSQQRPPLIQSKNSMTLALEQPEGDSAIHGATAGTLQK